MVKSEDTISNVNKKTFKEAFNADKARLDKRQAKYSKPQNFLLILEDNINSAVCTSGKLMVYGKGDIAQKFFNDGINYEKDKFYIHKNVHNFEEETQVKDDKAKETTKEKEIPMMPKESTKEKAKVTPKEMAKEKPKEKPLTKYDEFLQMTKSQQ